MTTTIKPCNPPNAFISRTFDEDRSDAG
jgi:hypothetical protein